MFGGGMELKEIKRGDLYYADLRPIIGSEQGGVRPVLIIQNDVGNHFSPTVIAASICTSQQKLDTNFKYYLSINLISVQYGASFATFLSG